MASSLVYHKVRGGRGEERKAGREEGRGRRRGGLEEEEEEVLFRLVSC